MPSILHETTIDEVLAESKRYRHDSDEDYRKANLVTYGSVSYHSFHMCQLRLLKMEDVLMYMKNHDIKPDHKLLTGMYDILADYASDEGKDVLTMAYRMCKFD